MPDLHSSTPEPMYLSRSALGLAALLLGANLLLFNWSITLWDEDEAAYAGFGLRMLESGDWVNPEYPWSDIHRKTPLHFWAIAWSFKLFGCNEFALRLPSALAVWGCCWALWRFGRRSFGRERSAWAALILAGSWILPLLYGKVSFTDAGLLFFQTCAVLGLLGFVNGGGWRYNLLFWSALSLGVLTKGPPILILCGGLWLWLAVFHPERKRLIGTHPWLFLPLALLPFAIWLYWSWQRDGGALLAFLYEWYLVKRVGGSVLGQSGPPGYHALVLLVAFLPWLPFGLEALGLQLRGAWRRASPSKIALAGWLLWGWLFYELMSSKLPAYSLAAQPAIALVIAGRCLDTEMRARLWFRIGAWIWVVLLFLLLTALGIFAFWAAPGTGRAWFYVLGLVFLLGGLGWRRLPALLNKDRFSALYNALMAMFVLTALVFGAAWFVEPSPVKSIGRGVEQAKILSGNRPDLTVYYSNLHIKQKKISLYFYLDRYFADIQLLEPEALLERFRRPEPALFLLGSGEAGWLLERLTSELPKDAWCATEWRSTDDQLKPHTFYWLRNYPL